MALSLQQIAKALNGRISNGQVSCAGPGHSSNDNSVSVKITDNGNDIIVNTFSPADDRRAVLKWAREKIGIPLKANGNGQSDADIAKVIHDAVTSQTRAPKAKGKIVATYDYKDADDALLYQNVRFEPKDFRQRRPDGKGGWIWNLNDVRRVLYWWPELIAYPDATVFVCEGEKDTNNVRALDLTATTVASGKWTQDCIDALAGRDCWIIQDVDSNGAGDRKAHNTANHLHNVAKSIKIVRLPGLTGDPDNKDVSDWLEQGHSKDELIEVCTSMPDWEPSDDVEQEDETTAPLREQQKQSERDENSDELPPEAEDAIALAFADRHAHELRYVNAWGHWLNFDGSRWADDTTLHTFDRVRAICREIAFVGDKPGRAVASAKTVVAVERLARADRRVAATVEQWDDSVWKLNEGKATFDLRTGASHKPDPLDYITKQTACRCAPVNTPHPLWDKFLKRITNHNKEMQAFLQRWCGYCCTGFTSEHVFVFAYGTGANGKSTFINTVADILGDYATTAHVGTFLASTSERHPTDLAKLRGARLVIAQETEKGRRWDETKIKALTGGDRIAARFMRQDFFDFEPKFKLLISGNHKPRLSNVDEAIRRRLLIVPFTVQIPLAERDPQLRDKLRAEWPAILRWIIDGCLQWQKLGLAPPDVVTNATAEYFADQDTIGEWLDECTAQSLDAFARSMELFASWKAWAENRQIRPGNIKNLSESLETRNFKKARNNTGQMGFYGLCIKG